MIDFFVHQCSFCSHLRGEHVGDSVHRSLEEQTSHQETEQHHIGEERAEVHHLEEGEVKREGESVHHTMLPWTQFSKCCTHEWDEL